MELSQELIHETAARALLPAASRSSGRRPIRQQAPSSGSPRSFIGKGAPSLLAHNSEIAALERRLAQEPAELGKVAATAACARATLLGSWPTARNCWPILSIAEKAFVSALCWLERVRREPDRPQYCKAAWLRPTPLEELLYPRHNVLRVTVFAIALLLWALGVLIVHAIRDHGH